ncbi:OprD family outer membrane porin [Marinomonas ostreistagni]|uniref:OprD family outer membrane porin n=1 Tax=Marinomonas ostreistagni TaxID=359209 RepID=UPI00194ED4D9|nr:OprD family outer membrane porin [Marinomonas ostreistagni]MBM6551473.1 OprD family outer membrane porin [Marinomonas ostreistagni]
MKMFKLGCTAVAVMPMVAFAANTEEATSVADAFQKSQISGAFQAYHFARESGSGADNEITTLGFDLSLETAQYKGFGFTGTFQHTSSPWADDEAKQARSSNMYGNGGQLSEAFLSYDIGNTRAQVGRMYFWTPVMGGSGSRVTREAFQGISIVNKDLANTTITAAYMDEFQARTDREGGIGEFSETFRTAGAPWAFEVEDGVYALSVKNTSIENLALTAAYVDAIDAFDTTYLESAFSFANYGIAAQYYSSQEDGEARGHLFGVKGTATLGKWDLLAAYTTTGDDADVIPGVGNGADLAYTWSDVFAYQYQADQDASKISADYNLTERAFVGSSYVLEDGRDYKRAYTAIRGGYDFANGLNVTAAYEMGSKDAEDDELRLRANYSF